MKKYDLIIIGGGPAGFSAGIYATRGGLSTGIFTGMQPGGQAALTHKIENYSGVKDAEGFALVNTMMEQAQSFGADVIFSSIEEVDFSKDEKILHADDGEIYSSKAVIIATGAKNKLIGLSNEVSLIGKGVSFCATCDGGFFKNKIVAVNGGGDTALTEALYLSYICREVYLIHRRKEFRAAQILVDRVYANPKIKVVLDSHVVELLGEPLNKIVVENKETHIISDIELSALFVAIGYTPNTELFKGKITIDEKGYILTSPKMETDIKGVFAAGDVRVTPMRQVITACADGAIAANSAIEYLH